MENIKEKLTAIIEQASCETPKCMFCKSYKDGGCSTVRETLLSTMTGSKGL